VEPRGGYFPPAGIVVEPTYSAGGAIQAALTWQAYFFMVWLAVAVGMGIWVAWRMRMVLSVTRQSAEAPEAVRTLLESCRRQLGIQRVIPVRCAEIRSPAICGVLRPVILIPPALAKDLSESEMRPVLLHELAHYKRGDLWVNHAQILLQMVYWYNPLLWLANASIRRAREQAVDEMVLVEMGGEAQAYPATLLHVAKLGLGRPLAAIGLMGIVEPGRGLTQRILHIMNRPLPRTARIGARGLATVLLLALVALPMGCHRSPEPVSTSESLEEQLRSQANAPDSMRGEITVGSYVQDILAGRRNQPLGRGSIGKVVSLGADSRGVPGARVDFGRSYVVGIKLSELSLVRVLPSRRSTDMAATDSVEGQLTSQGKQWVRVGQIPVQACPANFVQNVPSWHSTDVAAPDSVEGQLRFQGKHWVRTEGEMNVGSYMQDMLEGRLNQPQGRGAIGKIVSFGGGQDGVSGATLDFGRGYVVGVKFSELSLVRIVPNDQ
jgi:beta-lactamase regulating signal transducer with metallopeptidase domain